MNSFVAFMQRTASSENSLENLGGRRYFSRPSRTDPPSLDFFPTREPESVFANLNRKFERHRRRVEVVIDQERQRRASLVDYGPGRRR